MQISQNNLWLFAASEQHALLTIFSGEHRVSIGIKDTPHTFENTWIVVNYENNTQPLPLVRTAWRT